MGGVQLDLSLEYSMDQRNYNINGSLEGWNLCNFLAIGTHFQADGVIKKIDNCFYIEVFPITRKK